MASLPPVKRLAQEDFPTQKGWIAPLLSVLNDFLGSVYTALNRGLTFSENFRAQVKTVTVDNTQASFSAIQFASTIGNPAALWVVKLVDKAGAAQTVRAAVSVDWSYANGLISINNVSGLTKTTTATTNSSTSLTNVVGAEDLIVGQIVSGSGISAGTTITAISGTTVTISAAATASASGVLLTFSGKSYSMTVIATAG